MKKNAKFLSITLSFLALPQILFPTAAFAEIRYCNQMVVFKPRVALVDFQMHGPRVLAMKMDRDRMMRDLLALTGRTPVDCQGCIRDRFQTGDKQRARQYLVKRIQDMGLTPSIERTKVTSRSFGGGPPDMMDRFKAVNWDLISDSDLELLFFKNHMVSDLRKFVVQFLGWPEKPESFKRITVEMLRDVAARSDEGSRTQDIEFIKALKAKGLSVHFTHMDSLRMMDMLKSGAKLKPVPPPKAATKKRRREVPDENNLVADDATKVVNILAEFRGSKNPDEIIEIIAHYDTKTENAAGADDNGVGIVTTLELMRLMVQHPPQRTVRIIFSDREEIDSLGAEYHIEKIKSRPQEKIIAVLVPDMFGYSPLGRPKFVLEVGTEKDFTDKMAYARSRSFAMLMAKQWNLYTDRVADMEVLTHSAESEMGDHGPYWDADLPAIFIAAPLKPENPANHTSRDRVENMNFGIFSEVAHFLGEVLVRTSGARILPTDLNPEDLNFLKIALKPNSERTDEAAELYFELPKKPYSPPPYSSSSYSGFGSGPGSDGRSDRSKSSPGFVVAPPPTSDTKVIKMDDIDRANPVSASTQVPVSTPAPAKTPSANQASGGILGFIEQTAQALANAYLFRIRDLDGKPIPVRDLDGKLIRVQDSNDRLNRTSKKDEND